VVHPSAHAEKIAVVAGWIPVPWGGSEELWSRAALHLLTKQIAVAACIERRTPPHDRVQELKSNGVEIIERRPDMPFSRRAWRRFTGETRGEELIQIERFLRSYCPSLVILQSGGGLPPIEVVELCVEEKLPFVTIEHANCERWWLDDSLAQRFRSSLGAALRCFFVSRANLQLTEKQIGRSLPNAEVIQNPFNVDYEVDLPWPRVENGEIRLACVGRLDVRAKGQDILLEALARPAWAHRDWRLSLYGAGPIKEGIERLVDRFGLDARVSMEGHVSDTKSIWAKNHALVLPSRFEGLPLAIVEAMLCRRSVVVTDGAGNTEIVEEGVTGFIADAPTVASVADALERLWRRRDELEQFGRAAGVSIRNWVGRDPAKNFAEKIMSLLQ
jgi:glycosyltransferase involved in cell wall biosynthesis